MTDHVALGRLPHLVIPDTDMFSLRRAVACNPQSDPKAAALTFLASELDRAEIVKSDALPWNVVTMHARAEYRDDVTDDVGRLKLIYPDEEQWDGTCVSVLSPLGAAVLGLSEGHSIRWRTPSGGIRGATILHVLFQPYRKKPNWYGWQTDGTLL